MKIENFRSEKGKNRASVSATVSWEDCNRPTVDIYFETDEEFAHDLSCNPNAFLIACTIPAMHYGEKRVWIDAEVCPELRTGLEIAMGWMRRWYYEPNREIVRIEARAKAELVPVHNPVRAGLFFSGGIDSLSTLRTNRLNFPLEHPWSIKDGLLVYGLELDDTQKFEYVMNSLSSLARGTGITLIPVYTNLYLVYRNEDQKNKWKLWYYEFMGAALASVAHIFSKRLNIASIAADYDIPNQQPHGSHPLLDPNYSSTDLQIRHEGIHLSRFAKTKLVGEWDIALQHLRVCNQFKRYESGMLNCGKCEKCIRTMLALLAMGLLDKTQAFNSNDISEDLIMSVVKLSYSTLPLYGELIAPLAERGRNDLVRVIKDKIAAYHNCQKRNNRILKVKQFDNRYLNDTLVRLKRSILH